MEAGSAIEQEVKTLTVNEKLHEFITETLGLQQTHNLTGIVGKDSIFYSGKDIGANLGYHERAPMDMAFIAGKKSRVDLTTAPPSGWRRLTDELIAKHITKAGLNFDDSVHVENAAYLKEVLNLFVEFYHKHLRSPCVQPFLYVDYSPRDVSEYDFTFYMGHGDATKPVMFATVSYNKFKLLDKSVYNISENEIQHVSHHIMSALAWMADTAFVGKMYDKVNYPSINFSPVSVALMHLRLGRPINSPKDIYDLYNDVVMRTASANVMRNPSEGLSAPVPFEQLSSDQKLYLATLQGLVKTSFEGMVKRSSFNKVQAG